MFLHFCTRLPLIFFLTINLQIVYFPNKDKWDQFDNSHYFVKSDESKSILSIFSKRAKNNWNHSLFWLKKMTCFLKEQFTQIRSKSLTSLYFKEIKSNSLRVALLKDQRDRLAHSPSFLTSDEIDLLTVALF